MNNKNTLTMYVIRRKLDGLFFQSRGWDNSVWTDNLSKSRVFKSISGAKTSRGWRGSNRKWVPCEKPNLCWECRRSVTEPNEGCKKERGAYIAKTEDELPYQVVPVTMQVKHSIRLS